MIWIYGDFGIWDFGKIYFGNLGFWKNIFWGVGKIFTKFNLELRFCYELMKTYYVNWSVEGILSNWGIPFGRYFLAVIRTVRGELSGCDSDGSKGTFWL